MVTMAKTSRAAALTFSAVAMLFAAHTPLVVHGALEQTVALRGKAVETSSTKTTTTTPIGTQEAASNNDQSDQSEFVAPEVDLLDVAPESADETEKQVRIQAHERVRFVDIEFCLTGRSSVSMLLRRHGVGFAPPLVSLGRD